ncbi:MAG: hypothetical protein ACR2PT_09835 [Endozoicomonas sp.]
MDVLISASNAFCKYFNADLARLPSPDGKGIGTQPVESTPDCLAWQCHAVKRKSDEGEATDVIVVEARSRYVLLFSNPCFDSLEAFSGSLRKKWAEECVHMAIESGAVSKEEASGMFDQFLNTPMQVLFCRNTDRSINGHVSDAQQWLLQSYEHYGIDHLDSSNEFGLGRQINRLRKKAKPFPGARRPESFLPEARMLDDWLYRFARGMSQWSNSNTVGGDFPNPYRLAGQPGRRKARAIDDLLKAAESDNVVGLAEAQKMRLGEGS